MVSVGVDVEQAGLRVRAARRCEGAACARGRTGVRLRDERVADARDRLRVAPLGDVRDGEQDRRSHVTRLNCATPPE